MMNRQQFIALVVFFQLYWAHLSVAQQVIAPLESGLPYSEIKTWHEQRAASNLTTAERLDDLRRIVQARYGQQGRGGLEGPLFRNLNGVDPSIPGMEKTVRLIASDNPHVRKGAVRTMLYSREMSLDPRFKVISLNESQFGSDGKMVTDKDIRFKSCGMAARMEVKEIKIDTQRSNLAKYKVQIDKMAAEFARNGEMQVWINRHAALPALKAYAESKGVRVYDRVTTGDKTGQITGNTSMTEVLNDLHQELKVHGVCHALSGGAQVGFGIALVIHAAPEVRHHLRDVIDPSTRNTSSVLKLGKNGSLALAGVSMSATGMAQVATLFASRSETLSKLANISGAGPIVTVLLLLGAESFVIAEYVHGDLTRSQFWTMHADVVGGVVGALVGAQVGEASGGLIGFLITIKGGGWGAGPGKVFGKFAGSMVGGYVGSKIGGRQAKTYFEFQEAEKERKYEDFICRHYAAAL